MNEKDSFKITDTEKNSCLKLPNYLETHDKFENYVLFSNNSHLLGFLL